ncbi:aspartate/glutamate racemase family protein [Amycolatopsis jejuensis]|uniref:aspartate/glutamate racemase family protein n=1 Tax=Amycolatopsis jejuensis TaxID=330084 RepID=UPI0012E082A9|nr:aspartate/glutamate racemase family protein [Amycolatopsis jejuensis]
MARQHGIPQRCRSVRPVDVPILSLNDDELLLGRLAKESDALVTAGEADVIVLGCTGMLGVADALQARLERDGSAVPVIDPTRAALAWLENLVRLGVGPSRTTYFPPPAKEILP